MPLAIIFNPTAFAAFLGQFSSSVRYFLKRSQFIALEFLYTSVSCLTDSKLNRMYLLTTKISSSFYMANDDGCIYDLGSSAIGVGKVPSSNGYF